VVTIVVGKIQENDTYAFGFDAQTGKFENLVSKGIIEALSRKNSR
jgi:chaperonin GroEL